MKIVELLIDEDFEESGIEAISLVSTPAHEENWIAFNSEDAPTLDDNSITYRIVEDDFCSSNPLLDTLGEPYNDLISQGWVVSRVEQMNPERILKMSRERFSNPNDESYEDTVQFRIRFKYVGPRDNKNRKFCSDMLAKNRVYRMEDIEQLSNPEFGNYDIFTWRGSFNCRHTWVKLIYEPEGKIRNSGDSTRGLIQTDPLSTRLQPDTRPGATKRSADEGRGENQWEEGMPRTGPNLFAEIGPRGGIKKSDKAPKSDTPNPEPAGEGTAKGKATGKRGAVVSVEQEKTLQKKVDDFNEKDSNTKNGRATLGALKSVFQRGLGAYNVSHSPTVQSSEQWAYARVNAFLYLLKNGRPENKKYTSDFDLLPKDHPKAEKMSEDNPCWDGYEMIGLKDDGSPNCVPVDMTEDDFVEAISDYPEGVKNAAARAVKWADENGWGSCGTQVGKTRASQLAKGEPISVDTLKRMYSYLSRHKVDLESSKTYEDGCGKLMYDSWGGEAGLTYSERKLKQLENEKMTFAVASEDKMIIVGAAMIPNKMIHRYDMFGNKYYVYFSKDSIRKMANRFLKQKRTDETSIEHNGIKLGSDKVYVTESWISEDPIKDKSANYGFELPAGTWFVQMKVEDPKIWELVKQNNLSGFSVEGLFREKAVFSKQEEQINQIKQLLKSI
jgi:hypothetical protein